MTTITTAEAATLAKRSVGTINRWVAEGRLHPTRKLPGIRGAHLFEVQDVLDVVDELERSKAS